MAKRPGGELATRPLHFIWIADASGSMAGDKIQALNFAIRDAIPHMQKVADENPNAQVLVRALAFSSGAQWTISQPTPIADFKWTDVKAGGVTDMGKALSMVAEQLHIPPMTERALPPVLVLISDGQPTDSWQSGLDRMTKNGRAQKADRMALAIGGDADTDMLGRFLNDEKKQVFVAADARRIKDFFQFVTMSVTARSRSANPNEVPQMQNPFDLDRL